MRVSERSDEERAKYIGKRGREMDATTWAMLLGQRQ
jgi:hypothetical protein